MQKSVIQKPWGLFFIAPNYLFFLAFTLAPLLVAIWLSFNKANLVSAKFVGWANYKSLFNNPVFLRALFNTLLFVIGVVPITLILALFIATVIFPLKTNIQTLFRISFYLPIMLSGVILSIVWKWMFHPVMGVLNYLLGQMDLQPLLWTASPTQALPSLIFVVLTFTLGDAVILLLAGFGNIPTELWDAAEVDGAGNLPKFFFITLPLLRPAILFVLVTQTIAVFQVFVVVFVLTRGGPAYATETLVYHIYQIAFTQMDMGLAAAEGVILVLLVSGVALGQFRLLGEAVEY
jgi:multiple sugar transport system permease protein